MKINSIAFVLAIITAPLTAMQLVQFKKFHTGLQGLEEYLQGREKCTISSQGGELSDATRPKGRGFMPRIF